VLVAVLIAFLGRKALRRVDAAHDESKVAEAEAITVGESL
jgi:ACDE family multidrug resistance protein